MEQLQNKTQREKFFTTKNITVTATLSAIAFVLYMFVKFKLPFFPQFFEMQISDMPALIGGFMMGPIYGCIIIVIKCLLKMPFTSTGFVGELADIIIGIAFVLPASLIYKKWRTRKGAIASLCFGGLSATTMAMIANVLILVPFYVSGAKNGWTDVVAMLRGLFPNITQANFYAYYLPFAVLPFNILRCLICCLITFLLYKSLHKVINSMFKPRQKQLIQQNITQDTPQQDTPQQDTPQQDTPQQDTPQQDTPQEGVKSQLGKEKQNK